MRITIEKSISQLDSVWQQWEAEGSLHAFQTRAFVQTWIETAAAAQHRQPALNRQLAAGAKSASGHHWQFVEFGRRGRRIDGVRIP